VEVRGSGEGVCPDQVFPSDPGSWVDQPGSWVWEVPIFSRPAVWEVNVT
jgi:hypothetical protein